jgi:hypothetical protein
MLASSLILFMEKIISLFFLQHMGVMQSPMSWNGAPAHASTPVVKKLVRLDVPVDKYPNVRMDFSSASVTLFSVLCHVMS